MAEGIVAHCRNGIATITINRPHCLNACTEVEVRDLTRYISEAADDPAIKVAIVTGAGEAFSTGADLSSGEINPDTAMDIANSLIRSITNAPIPVIAQVNGVCAGMSVGLALSCDIVCIADIAYFLLPFADVGLMPDAGATALIPASIGRIRAMKLALIGEPIYGAEAVAMGMASSVHPVADLTTATQRIAERMATRPRDAIGATKRAINATTISDIDAALTREKDDQSVLLRSDDHREGVAAYREKRRPKFTS